jgi:pimeloyl-ACP methyl ester carboxylesterase
MSAITCRVPGLVLTERTFAVPLDHSQPGGEQIAVFAREVVAAQRVDDDLPWLVFLQGGPGFEAPRPLRQHTPAWLERALKEFRVLMLDQRGVGRSSPFGPRDTAQVSPTQLAERLTHYRADSIVRDAERVRRELGIEKWAVLGQSFGGFCVVSYLSLHPEALSMALLTGGLPPLDRSIDEVYEATYRRTADKVANHYARYPEDHGRVSAAVKALEADDVRLPSGDRLTPERFRQLGILLGRGDGSEELHYLLELPFGSPAFLHDVEASSLFSRNPFYAVVHESCYAPGLPTRWAAQRLLPDAYAADPTLLTGEHVFPWMFQEYAGLRPFADAAEILAQYEWGDLYDVQRLGANEVPCAAAVYADDMYVEREFSEETAARISGLRMWLTNEYEHDGLTAGGGKVLDRLLDLARGRV